MPTEKDVKQGEVKTAAAGLAVGAADYLAGTLPINPDVLEAVTAPGYGLAAALVAAPVVHYRWYFSSHQRFLRQVRGEGWLDRHDLGNTCGQMALRRQAASIRPKMKGRGKATEYGWKLGKLVSGARYLRGRAVYTPGPRPVGLVGPTESGKTQLLVNGVLDTPGPAVVTSTKTELVELTQRLRQQVGPTAVFNPQGLGGVENTFMWDPVSGCEDQQVADARAWALVRGAGGADGVDRSDFWASRAQEIIRCYLMAAALKGWDMGAVMYWSQRPDDYTPVNVLEAHPAHVPEGWAGLLTSRLEASHNTRTGYFATVTAAVSFMDNPRVAAACRPPAGQAFDVEQFLRTNGTLYLVGGQQDKRIAPLLTALNEYIFGRAQQAAAAAGGRLDPYLTFWLDEVANISPVPLDTWTTDSRGWGIRIVAVLQALSQLETTWGSPRGETIWNNLVTKIVLPGVTDDRDLEKLAYLAGKRWKTKVTENENSGDEDGRGRSTSTGRSSEREQVVEGQTIANMPKWHVYVHGLGRHPAVLKFEPGYKRVRRELRRLGKHAEPQPAPGVTWQPEESKAGAPA